MKRLSVVLITKNEAGNLARCLDSVRWADELIVVDSHSSDGTADLARRYTQNVYTRDFTDYADQKNFALAKTSGEWVLSVDADEVVSDGLRKEIQDRLRGNPAPDGFFVPRKNIMFRHAFRFSGTQNDKPLRLFRKSAGHFEKPIHETVVLRGTAGKLEHPLLHYSYSSISDYLKRLNRYTSLEAAYLAKKPAKGGWSTLLLKPLFQFFRLWVLRQGYRDGFPGIFFCGGSSYYVFLKHAKRRELAHGA